MKRISMDEQVADKLVNKKGQHTIPPNIRFTEDEQEELNNEIQELIAYRVDNPLEALEEELNSITAHIKEPTSVAEAERLLAIAGVALNNFSRYIRNWIKE